jgi:glyoxylate reductase
VSEKFRIFVTQPILAEGLAILEQHAEVRQNLRGRPLTEAEMVEVGKEFDPDAYVGTFAEPNRVFSSNVIAASKRLKAIGWNGLSNEHIDLQAATARGIYVTYVDISCPPVADQAFALLLAAARLVIPADGAVRAGEWQKEGVFLYKRFIGRDVHHRTIGIVGMGRIGAGVARRAAGFDMRILYHDQIRRKDIEDQFGAEAVDFQTLLCESDFVCCCLSLSQQTREFFDADAFAQMKPDAIFVNVTRGGCVDTDALVVALQERRIEMAALDVIAPEPLPADHPILKLDNVILAPHVAGVTRESRVQAHVDVAEDTIRVLRGKIPKLLMNKEVIDVRPLR